MGLRFKKSYHITQKSILIELFNPRQEIIRIFFKISMKVYFLSTFGFWFPKNNFES